MPTDTPYTSRVALEALAERLARYSVRESNALEDDLLQAAATLRALAARVIELEVERLQAIAARAEPPAEEGAKPRMEQSDNVAALVEEAREFAGKSMRSADTYRETRRRELADEREEVADLVSRLAAALTAQVERIAELEALLSAVMDVETVQPSGDPTDPLSWAPVASYVVAGSVHDDALARADRAEALNREAGEMLLSVAASLEEEIEARRAGELPRRIERDLAEVAAARALADKIAARAALETANAE